MAAMPPDDAVAIDFLELVRHLAAIIGDGLDDAPKIVDLAAYRGARVSQTEPQVKSQAEPHPGPNVPG